MRYVKDVDDALVDGFAAGTESTAATLSPEFTASFIGTVDPVSGGVPHAERMSTNIIKMILVFIGFSLCNNVLIVRM
jgi:hypothetical protein